MSLSVALRLLITSSPSQPAPARSRLSPRVNTLQPKPWGRLPNLPLGQTIRCLSLAPVIALWSPPASSPRPEEEEGEGGQQAAKLSLPTPRAPAHGSPGGNDTPPPREHPHTRIPDRDAPAAKSALLPTPSRSRVSPPSPPPRVFQSLGSGGGWAGG